MTQDGDSQQVYENSVAMIRELAPTHAQEVLISCLRPAIAIEAEPIDESLLPLGTSKFFGDPDVPADFDWPLLNGRPALFLSQFNLANTASFDVNMELPERGIISFFYGFDDYSDLKCMVFCWPEVQRRLPMPRQPPQGFLQKLSTLISTSRPKEPCCALRFFPEWTLPDLSSPQAKAFQQIDCEELEPLGNEFYSGGHQLLGHAAPVQGDVEFEAARSAGNLDWRRDRAVIESDAPNWRLLFQMDSQMPHWLWGDLGMLYFMVPESDLCTQRFERTQLICQFT